MAVEKLLLIILMMALSGSYSKLTDVDDVVNRKLRLSNGKFGTIKTIKSLNKIMISCPVDGDEPITLPLREIPKMSQTEYSDIVIENFAVESFGALFEHLGIKEEAVTFQVTNASQQSFEVVFPSGFEKVENLLLSHNQIIQLNADMFQSMAQLSTLDLSHNEIEELPENVFQNLTNLETLKLNENRLTSLHEGMFKYLKILTVLTLDNNRLMSVTKEMFQGLDSLSELSLQGNDLQSLTDDVFNHIPQLLSICIGYGEIKLPYNIFTNHSRLKYVFIQKVKIDNNGLNLTDLVQLDIKWSVLKTISTLSNIQNISITECELDSLPNNLFANTSVVTFLNLSSNKLTRLDDGLFSNLTNLERLLLKQNRLTNISKTIFGDLRSLIEIDLSDNLLTTIDPKAFANTKQLEIVNLKNNQLTFTDNKLPFIHLNKLRNLILSSNHLTRMPSELTLQLANLTELDISYNKIKRLKFRELRNVNINLTHEILIASTNNIYTYLNGNPLECDCGMYNFLLGTDQEKFAVAFNLTPCYRKYYAGPAKCPSECECSEIAIEGELLILISCEGRALKTVPEIDIRNATTIELNISRNRLRELPKLQSNFRAIIIQASYNQISMIERDKLPPNLRALDVSHNHIRTITAAVLDHITNHKSLEIILMKGNPFSCHCSENMEKLVKFTSAPITDLHGGKCDDKYEMSKDVLDYLCATYFVKGILIFAIVLAIIVMISGFLFYKHQQSIKVRLYNLNCCLWWIDEEYVDNDKEFDAFISYSHLDVDYADKLIDRLEKGTPSFKLCIHERDFVGGRDISQSINESVEKSRRTIIILTKNFLESRRGREEFNCAYTRAMAEGRNRLIVIKKGDLGDVTKLDATIKTYVDTKTYIKSSDDPNDPAVISRILFALPHKNLNRNRNANVNENINLEIMSHNN